MPGHQNIDSIFLGAIELDSTERDRYLQEACGSDRNLRSQIEELLEAHSSAGDFMLTNGPQPTTDLATAEQLGQLIGPYKLLQEIGEGGFGVVYMAEQTEPVRRKVALKIIKPGMDSKEVIARFEAERQALAMMDHPNIAKILGAGTTNSGRPYFAMELVKGVPITEFCDTNKMSFRDRLDLFATVCRAVQHAHQKGVIHRDLKPSNIMVTLHDNRPMPVIIDFGVSKAISYQLTAKTLFTAYGQMVGTPAYMSPEQAQMSRMDIDTRSDIYSLGVLLYELLTGTTPLDAERLRGTAYAELQRLIREEEPPRPSIRVSTHGNVLAKVSQDRSTDPSKLSQLLRGDLDWIILKAIEKERNRRYESATALALDVERYLDDQAVHACPPSVGYQIRKFIKRHRSLVTTVAVLMIAISLGIVGTTAGMIQAKRDAERARNASSKAVVAKERADALAIEKQQEAEKAIASEAKANARLDELNAAHERLEREKYARTMQVAFSAFRDSKIKVAKELMFDTPAKLRGWEWNYLARQRFSTLFKVGFGANSSACFSPDGRRILVADGDGKTSIWDATKATEVPILTVASRDYQIFFAHFSNDGRRFITAAPEGETVGNGAIVCDSEKGTQLFAIGEQLTHAVFSTDDSMIASASTNGEIHFWDATTGKHRRQFGAPAGRVMSLEFSAGQKRLLISRDHHTEVWDLEREEKLFSIPGDRACFSPDGSMVVVSDATMFGEMKVEPVRRSSRIAVFDAADGSLKRSLFGPTKRETFAVSFSPDGSKVIATSIGSVYVWDVDSGVMTQQINGHTPIVRSAVFSPDGSRIATAGYGGAKIWDARTNHLPQIQTEYVGIINRSSFSPDGRSIVATARMARQRIGSVKIWDLETGETIKTLDSEVGSDFRKNAEWIDWGGVFSPDGTRVVITEGRKYTWSKPSDSSPRVAEVWDARTGGKLFSLEHDFSPTSAAFSPDNRLIVTSCTDGKIVFWDAETGQEVRDFKAHEQAVSSIVFHPAGKQILTSSLDKTARVWNVDSLEEALAIEGHSDMLFYAEFSPDGSKIVTASMDSTAKIWNAVNGDLIHTLEGHFPGVFSASFSNDGTRLATGGGDVPVKIWDVSTGLELFKLYGPSGWGVAFSPNDSYLVTNGPDGMIVWDARPVRDLAESAGVK